MDIEPRVPRYTGTAVAVAAGFAFAVGVAVGPLFFLLVVST